MLDKLKSRIKDRDRALEVKLHTDPAGAGEMLTPAASAYVTYSQLVLKYRIYICYNYSSSQAIGGINERRY